MKKHTLLSDIAVFLLIIFLLIVPPFFAQAISSSRPLFVSWDFPLYKLLFACLAGAILFFYYEKNDDNNSVNSVWQKLNIFPVLFTFGMLFAISLLSRFLSEIAGADSVFADHATAEYIVKPQGFIEWLFCLIYFLCGAFYEEVIYRVYLTDELYSLVTRKKIWRFSKIICECAGLLCFAFAHRYMGWIPVFNAALAHIVLRFCYKKSGRLWPCVVSHFVYNVISLILL